MDAVPTFERPPHTDVSWLHGGIGMPEPVKLDRAAEDYVLVRDTIQFISENWREQPELETIAAAVGTDSGHLHRLFTRWAGLTPKAFVQALTLDEARRMLSDSQSILDTAYEVGLSGPGRLHDLFVTHEAMSPGAYKARGAGVTIAYGFHPSPFGTALVMATERGLAGLAFADPGEEAKALADMSARWPAASYVEDTAVTAPYARQVFDPRDWSQDRPLRLVLIGSDFEVRVWETLLRIPLGKATTYTDIARHIGNPKAARAVGAAVGRNPISFVVPCHRVLGRQGNLCGYHWGLTRKKAILGWETGLVGLLSGGGG
ncbi:bifunctional transcriptional activator/DNA repair enzyme Ada [Pleomorphomonas sp. SM30]|uniref:methylated-DNA--[protein]-cysteine S-methyltransferase n=2 Tax=Oharaeibacter diazotrophicus TaxID=1920512 RepID=A0A4V3CW50_9HYPH|nr:AraC family transcriptional regulator of adaptative response/methylated-DNA-[protein]-cysteine methyltransferase [Oharaeibacter diazotrophicus]BBE73967.1 bifunctional transcriptional activator/DNA repair enzyme Ada [Pleomorphomonas sp. SM30]GLS76346.1 6-O-methylguanine DNA methyltransferase [Oharaeibacter diazotrophicus]